MARATAGLLAAVSPNCASIDRHRAVTSSVSGSRPPPWPRPGPPRDRVAAHVEDLLRPQPVEAALDLCHGTVAADFQQRVANQAGVPDRRDAGLAIGLVLVHGEKLFDRCAGDGALRIALRIAERVEHHDAVGHGGEKLAEAVLRVEPPAHPGDRAVRAPPPRPLWQAPDTPPP